MKRLMALLVCLLLCCVSVSAATAGDREQVIELTAEGDTLTFVATNPTTFWESPTLRMGETVLEEGTLTLVNNTDVSRDILFDGVQFPYQDAEALQYLNHLFITIKQDDTVLYDGAYSCINNRDVKPQLGTTLEPQASCTYTISLRCDYTYTDTHYLNDEILDWIFTVETEATTDFFPEQSTDSPLIFDHLFWQVPLALVLALILFLIVSRATKH